MGPLYVTSVSSRCRLPSVWYHFGIVRIAMHRRRLDHVGRTASASFDTPDATPKRDDGLPQSPARSQKRAMLAECPSLPRLGETKVFMCLHVPSIPAERALGRRPHERYDHWRDRGSSRPRERERDELTRGHGYSCQPDEVAFCSSSNGRRETVAPARSRPRPPEHPPPASDYVDPLDLSISMST
jgi:hypothetical protein